MNAATNCASGAPVRTAIPWPRILPQLPDVVHLLTTTERTYGVPLGSRRGSAPRILFHMASIGFDFLLEIRTYGKHLLMIHHRDSGLGRRTVWRPGERLYPFIERSLKEYETMALKKCANVGDNGSMGRVSPCDLMPVESPLYDHLTQELWEDGTARQTSTIGISVHGGRVLITLRDREVAKVAFASGDSFSEALDQLRQGLETGELAWRRDQFARQGGRDKGKK